MNTTWIVLPEGGCDVAIDAPTADAAAAIARARLTTRVDRPITVHQGA